MINLRASLNTVQAALFAPSCILCHAPATRSLDLCAACCAELPWQAHDCMYCGLALPPDSKTDTCTDCQRCPRFDGATAAFSYQPPVDWLITRLKFHSRFSHARLLGTLLASRIAAGGHTAPDYMVPVPLHPRRHRQRGYNQAEMLARQISRRLDIPVRTDIAIRRRHTSPQLALPANERKGNVHKAFAARRSCAGSHVAIVDDVVTTGHTAAALANVLKQNGAASVRLWCVARA